MKYLGGILAVFLFPGLFFAQSVDSEAVLAQTGSQLRSVAASSFPEINIDKLRVKTFKSDENFFKARFSVYRFLTFRPMRHLLFVNAAAFERSIPENALRAILAHELAHILYYTRKNRLQLAGLVRLTNGSANTNFERKADFEAIIRGYGDGLIAYREWLYRQISAESKLKKSETYFTPDEIRLLMKALREKPHLIKKWKKSIPRSEEEIELEAGYE